MVLGTLRHLYVSPHHIISCRVSSTSTIGQSESLQWRQKKWGMSKCLHSSERLGEGYLLNITPGRITFCWPCEFCCAWNDFNRDVTLCRIPSFLTFLLYSPLVPLFQLSLCLDLFDCSNSSEGYHAKIQNTLMQLKHLKPFFITNTVIILLFQASVHV